jgi:DNA topoisomerase-1
VLAVQALLNIGPSTTESEAKKNIVKAIDLVSQRLGNTRCVCKKYYIHPVVFESYENGRLQSHTHYETQMQCSDGELAPEEQVVLKLLETAMKASNEVEASLKA